MATLREYFDTDSKDLTIHKDWTLHDQSGAELEKVRAKISYNFEANARYWYFFVPKLPDLLGVVASILSMPEIQRCVLGPEGDGVLVLAGLANDPDRQSNETLLFTRRVQLYIDEIVSLEQRAEILRMGSMLGLFISLRDRSYAATRSEHEKPLAFISHDSRDKDVFVRELALEMSKMMCPVWYDEYSLIVGDSLRGSIESGLKEAKKCVLFLSPNFLSNGGWTKAEFDSIFTREILEQKNVVLPVWHNVNVKSVYEYSPRLADKVGLPTSLGVKEVARKLVNAVRVSA